ncbi:MAG: GSU2403 family nucleotidyltransferase fold protein [Nitrospiraceae bacterium]
MERLPLETQTLYAELLEQLTAIEAHRSIGRVPGCFVTKTVKGETYYYFQHSDPGGVLRQRYVGKRTPVLEKVVARFQEEKKRFQTDAVHIQRLCAQLRAGGTLVTDSASGRVLKAFAESGVFHLGGVLVGTHAFTVLGNLLGVRWTHHAVKTQDIDIAGASGLQIAVPNLQADVPKTLESLEMGFLPVPSLDPKHPSTSFKVRGSALRVDLLTPARKSAEHSPIVIGRFNVAAQPLPFLDYLVIHYETGALINGGGVLVNVPNPARFAFHKLIVSQSRGAAAHGKAGKDLEQAAQIFSVLAEDRPGDLQLAWEDLEQRGTNWVKQIIAPMRLLGQRHPTEHRKLTEAIPAIVERLAAAKKSSR